MNLIKKLKLLGDNMNKEEILKELNKLFPDEPVDRLNRVIDTYNFIFASLYGT